MRTIALALVLLVLQVSAAQAEYRAGQPPVLAPAPTPVADDGDAAISRFRTRYQAARTPTVALFWNRELTDAIAQRTVQRSSTSSSNSSSVTSVAGVGEALTETLAESGTTTLLGREVQDDGAADSLDPRSDALLKTAFLGVLQRGGVRIVDRALMVRAAATAAPAGVDAQSNEMRGLADRATWLLEVVLVPDDHAPLGHAFRVAVKDVGRGTLITELVTQAVPPARAPTALVAMNGVGFVRAPTPAPTVDEVGRALGVELLDRLAQAL